MTRKTHLGVTSFFWLSVTPPACWYIARTSFWLYGQKEAICSFGQFRVTVFYLFEMIFQHRTALPLQTPCIWRDLHCASICLSMLYAFRFMAKKRPSVQLEQFWVTVFYLFEMIYKKSCLPFPITQRQSWA